MVASSLSFLHSCSLLTISAPNPKPSLSFPLVVEANTRTRREDRTARHTRIRKKVFPQFPFSLSKLLPQYYLFIFLFPGWRDTGEAQVVGVPLQQASICAGYWWHHYAHARFCVYYAEDYCPRVQLHCWSYTCEFFTWIILIFSLLFSFLFLFLSLYQ